MALVIVQAGNLDGVELLPGREVEQLGGLPSECAQRVGVEAEFDGDILGFGRGRAAAAAAGRVPRKVRRRMSC